ncbi:transglycosylase domain-containing protein [Phorcysia thermohydrogeniphila]|uniref:Penicillin-binding protein 1A n=1 Tax=Phorcysia thermohydrogeniphila TaxID=936138 RepID=A0A4R1GKK6_9BACT|nr:PBP1A family penicillin-binding protein [Phorcysia thermohydrogeniphila]TCK06579.1 penicillin-binding protein 1A [Phorcysia thermohydrogeniphila]
MKLVARFLFFFFLWTLSVMASPAYKEKLLPDFASVVYDRNGKIIGFFYKGQFRLYASYKEFPEALVDAVITAEDERFFEHKGIDPLGILRAAVTDLAKGKIVQGGSTITQQLAKLIYLSPKRTIERKLKELALARKLEEELTKEEILELYLNYVYLSNGAYGVKAAAWVLFGKSSLRELTTAQCALLAGIIRGPEYYNPFKHPERALKRRNFILRKMLRNGYITREEYEKAIREPLTPLKRPNRPRVAGYELDLVKFEIARKGIVPYDSIYTAGYRIKTTIDERAQRFAQKVLTRYAKRYAEEHELDDLQCAGMAINTKGEVLFVVGGTDYRESKLNRAFQTLRPIGSTAKPFTYLTAFQNGWSPLDFISNEQIEMPTGQIDEETGEEIIWRPENYSKRFTPFIQVRKALMKSVNVATIHLAMNFPQKIRKNLIKFELIKRSDPFDLSYVLGSFSSNLYRIVRAYSAIQGDGVLKEPFVISWVKDRHGRTIYRGSPTLKIVSDSQSIELLRSILQDVVKEGTARSISYLTNWFDVAGKTGTTNEYRDTYFTGFTTSFVMSIWFGRDSYKTMWERATGGGVAAPPWGVIARKLCKLYGCGQFEPSYDEIVKNYPLPIHFPEREMEELYYDELINSLREDEEGIVTISPEKTLGG